MLQHYVAYMQINNFWSFRCFPSQGQFPLRREDGRLQWGERGEVFLELLDIIVLTDYSLGKGNGNEKESEIEKDY